MSQTVTYVPERLDHLGTVAGVCQEIGLAAYLDALQTSYHARVSVGTATVAIILNGLGFSNPRLYLVPQFFADKPVETLLGPGITANEFNHERSGVPSIGSTPTTRRPCFRALPPRPAHLRHRDPPDPCGHHLLLRQWRVPARGGGSRRERDCHHLRLSARSSRRPQVVDARVRHHPAGRHPLFLRPLNGNSSDQRTWLAAVQALAEKLRTPEGEEERIYIADGGVYSSANTGQSNEPGPLWESRVPETLAEAKAALARTDASWQTREDGGRPGGARRLHCLTGRNAGLLCQPAQANAAPEPPSSAKSRLPSRRGSRRRGTS